MKITLKNIFERPNKEVEKEDREYKFAWDIGAVGIDSSPGFPQIVSVVCQGCNYTHIAPAPIEGQQPDPRLILMLCRECHTQICHNCERRGLCRNCSRDERADHLERAYQRTRTRDNGYWTASTEPTQGATPENASTNSYQSEYYSFPPPRLTPLNPFTQAQRLRERRLEVQLQRQQRQIDETDPPPIEDENEG